jgi:hypothetical protein
MNNTTEQDALTTVMADAGALPCIRCGRRTAVRVAAAEGLREHAAGIDTEDLIWCFECGYEEPAAH